jgi:hypothetical protein
MSDTPARGDALCMNNDLGTRVIWLVLVPTAFAVLAWIVLFAGPGDAAHKIAVAAFVPLPGLIAVPSYRLVTHDPVPRAAGMPRGPAAP